MRDLKICKPSVIWITGLSGAGKTTVANELTSRLRDVACNVIFLDGDVLRQVFDTPNNIGGQHGHEARQALAQSYSRLCQVLSSQGFTVVIATISLFSKIHDWNRINFTRYFEVYLKIPIEELRRRDPKRIYRLFDEGKIRNVAGLDLPIEEPASPDLVVNFYPSRSAAKIADQIIEKLNQKGWINEAKS